MIIRLQYKSTISNFKLTQKMKRFIRLQKKSGMTWWLNDNLNRILQKLNTNYYINDKGYIRKKTIKIAKHHFLQNELIFSLIIISTKKMAKNFQNDLDGYLK